MMRFKPWLSFAMAVLLVCLSFSSGLRTIVSPDPLESFLRLPVREDGRLKPMDTLLRQYALIIQGHQRFRIDEQTVDATTWLMSFHLAPERMHRQDMILVEHPMIFSYLGPKYYKQKYRVSYQFLSEHREKLQGQAERAMAQDASQRSDYQKQIISLWNRIQHYESLVTLLSVFLDQDFQDGYEHYEENLDRNMRAVASYEEEPGLAADPSFQQFAQQLIRFSQSQQGIALVPPIEDPDNLGAWQSLPASLLSMLSGNDYEGLELYSDLVSDYKSQDWDDWSEHIDDYLDELAEDAPSKMRQVSWEYYLNTLSVFNSTIWVYVWSIFILIGLGISQGLKRPWNGAYALSVKVFNLAVLIHSLGLIARIYIHGRPPVTNLYSSALFVGWVAVLVAIYIEKKWKQGLGIVLGSTVGILTLIIAHHLSFQGDSLSNVQAVLNSNFWLSTHVITITIGYGLVFLAGILGVFYILAAFLTRYLADLQRRKAWVQLAHRLVILALVFSFVGTVLGGIWADQSWGRFWGWDPKENGALLIVLWMAIMLHARLAGWVRDRGFMVLAVGGNIVCSFSWFGVNLLGVGLHSYGFTDSNILNALLSFWATQFMIILVGALPLSWWKSLSPSEH